MTQNRRSKRAIRSRMAQTGEKYTEARRVLLVSGGHSGDAGGDRGVAVAWPRDLLGWFSDQAYNAILLADDEARMLSHATVDPEHLLLAAARTGNVERLLGEEGIEARAIHDAIVRVKGVGTHFQPKPGRSPASEQVLGRAVAVAMERGVLGPSTEHLLLAFGEQALSAQLLAELGITDVQGLVDAVYPVRRPPVDYEMVQRRAAQLAASDRAAPRPGPIPPIFERFSTQVRQAIDAGIDYARKLDDPYVEPAHLLMGLLDAKTGVIATVRSELGWRVPPVHFIEPRHPKATDIFTRDARRRVAEDVLIVAERLDYRTVTTGHLLIAILERPDERSREIMSILPNASEISAAVLDALPDKPEM